MDSLQNKFFRFMKVKNPSLMCVDTSNSFNTKEWFQKTLNQHCNICDKEICIKTQLERSYWRYSWFNLEEFEVEIYRNLSWILCRPNLRVHERGKPEFSVCGHIKQFHYKRMLSKDSKVTLYRLCIKFCM